MTGNFKDRYGPTALVTGASSGIGEAFAKELAKEGFNLVLAARRIERLQSLGDQLSSAYGIVTHVVEVDLAQTEATTLLLEATAAMDVGLVVSNAGFSMKGQHEDNDPRALTEMLMVNCHVPLQLTGGFIPRLKKRGQGGIILTSSVEGLLGCPYSAAYSSTKALVKALGEALWGELHPNGIDVLTLCPGPTETEALAKSGTDVATLQNLMTANDVARLTLDNIANGPTFISSDYYQSMFEHLLSLPRREALKGMAAALGGK